MNTIQSGRLAIWLLLLLAGGACTRQPQKEISAGVVVVLPDADDEWVPLNDKLKLRREAVVEHRYTTDAKCAAAARKYYQNVLHNSGEPVAIPGVPKTYSMKMAGRNKEVRFLAGKRADIDVSFGEVQPTVPNPTDDTNLQDLKDAITALGTNVTVLEGPTLDPSPTNSKRAWRVVLYSPKSVGPERLAFSGTFGLVINPPYP